MVNASIQIAISRASRLYPHRLTVFQQARHTPVRNLTSFVAPHRKRTSPSEILPSNLSATGPSQTIDLRFMSKSKSGRAASVESDDRAVNQGRYCLDCGRLMPNDHRSDPTPRKYCSSTCRSRSKEKHRIPFRQQLIQTFHDRLADPDIRQRKENKGVVLCSEVEIAVMQQREQRRTAGGQTSSSSGLPVRNADSEDENDVGSKEQSTLQSPSTGSDLGRDIIDHREEARRAARRIVAFGWHSQGIEDDRSVQAVQNGKEVETSFAKGEWGLRWRER